MKHSMMYLVYLGLNLLDKTKIGVNCVKECIQIALLGMGTVGSGVYEVIEKMQKEDFKYKVGADVCVKTILVRSPEKYRDSVEAHTKLTKDWQDIVNDEDIDIVVEVMGGIEPAKTYILDALRHGKNVVSANKDLIAVCGSEIHEEARKAGKDFMYEAAVLGAIPIVQPLKESLAGNHISEIVGIMNGTTNYILTQMTNKGWDFDEALKKAQELGYAEADPTADVMGLDAGRKVAILANIAFHTPAVFDDVYVEGITKISSLDIDYANSNGCVIKLLGAASCNEEGITLRVHPALIAKEHPLASVSGSFNAAFISGDAVGDCMFYGRGAGKLPTASAIVGDVIDICRNIAVHAENRVGDFTYKKIPICPLAKIKSRFYVRLHVPDRTGVLADVGRCLGDSGVSIAQVMQKTSPNVEGAQLVIITHEVMEEHFNQAVQKINELYPAYEVANVIRVYGDMPQ